MRLPCRGPFRTAVDIRACDDHATSGPATADATPRASASSSSVCLSSQPGCLVEFPALRQIHVPTPWSTGEFSPT